MVCLLLQLALLLRVLGHVRKKLRAVSVNDFTFQASLPLLEAPLLHLKLHLGVDGANAALKLAEIREYDPAAGLLQLAALSEVDPLSLLLIVFLLIAHLHLKLA